MPSTRYRDVVDLVAIVTGAPIAADAQRTALTSEFERRGLSLPGAFDIPDRGLWRPGYAAEARKSLLTNATTLDDALAAIRPFIDPILDRRANGTWNPERQLWR